MVDVVTDRTGTEGAADATEAGGVEPQRTTLATMSGKGIARADVAGTGLLVLAIIVVAVAPDDATELFYLVTSLALFLGGSVAFVVGFLRAVGRSRTEVVDMAGLFYLTGTAPRVVRRLLLGLWITQIGVVALSLAVAPPFGVVAVLWGIGLLPLWGARHGRFPPIPDPGRPARRSAPE